MKLLDVLHHFIHINFRVKSLNSTCVLYVNACRLAILSFGSSGVHVAGGFASDRLRTRNTLSDIVEQKKGKNIGVADL